MEINTFKQIATTVRSLSMDAIQAANSGHPGLPMGCAELGAVLYGSVLNINPEHPDWINRDRFVLSAGHGSMFLYSLLYLSGFEITLDEIKKFRQLGSRTAGHPEYRFIPGIETTTGPLGAGFSNAVGMAIAETQLAERFNTPEFEIIDHFTYVLSGDGCLMEGLSSEAASLAGHLKLGKLIVFYDSNRITIEGSTDLAFSEDVIKRFEAYGWQALEGDAHDFNDIASLVDQAKCEKNKPTLIKLNSIIGKGSPNKAGSHSAHGAPLGADEIIATRKNIGLKEDDSFYVAPEALEYFAGKRKDWNKDFTSWNTLFAAWSTANSVKRTEWDRFFAPDQDIVEKLPLPEYKAGESLATRSASGKALQVIGEKLSNLIGGSADLAPSNNTVIKSFTDYSVENRGGQTLRFGVREHAMGGVINGLALHSNFKAFGATFLVFSDYMRPAIRLSALMKLPVVYIFTHDSIFVGEDGPTHQPIEHVMALRLIPGLNVMRPADAEETSESWRLALSQIETPTCLILTRQNLDVLEKPEHWKEGLRKGAYIIKEAEGTPDAVIVATGSEVNLAVKAAAKSGKNVQIVSMPCMELFRQQDKTYRDTLFPAGVKTIVVEAGVSIGWEGIASSRDHIVSIDRFGESGPAAEVAKHLGLTEEAVLEKLNL